MKAGRVINLGGTLRRSAVSAIAVLLALAGLAVAGAARAEEATVFITLDHARIMPYPAGTETIVVGNPIIADVTMLKSANRVILTGRGFGETNLVFLDQHGAVLSEARLRVRESAALLTVQRGTDRESYSCQPRCQPAVSLGDASSFLHSAASDIQLRDGLATGAAATNAVPPR